MPLAFHSAQGLIPFGFFHIETDLLLCEQRFFWCRDFCALVDALLATDGVPGGGIVLPGWRIRAATDCGDLHGAIAGTAHGGLIGALYARWPFPRQQGAFRQRSAGAALPDQVTELLDRFGERTAFAVRTVGATGIEIDGTCLARTEFSRLVDYVWRGGMPGWEGRRRPDYLAAAARRWQSDAAPWVTGIDFSDLSVGYRG